MMAAVSLTVRIPLRRPRNTGRCGKLVSGLPTTRQAPPSGGACRVAAPAHLFAIGDSLGAPAAIPRSEDNGGKVTWVLNTTARWIRNSHAKLHYASSDINKLRRGSYPNAQAGIGARW